MISAVVLHVASQSSDMEHVLEQLAAEPRLDVGSRCGQKLPLVLAVDDRQEMECLTDWLQTLPGVQHLDVTFVSF